MSVVAIRPQGPRRRWPLLAAAGVGTACLVVAATTALVPGADARTSASSTGASTSPTSYPAMTAGASQLGRDIERLQGRLRAVPADDAAWATLAIDYVQQAKVTVDPTYYPKAQAALTRSLRLNATDNYLAMAGEATLASARHDFRAVLRWARRGLAVDPRNALLYGALTDALTQLGRYGAAGRA